MRRFVTALVILLCNGMDVLAQGTSTDYERASHWEEQTREKLIAGDLKPFWLKDGSRFVYRISLGDQKRSYTLVDPATKRKSAFLDLPTLAKALSDVLKQPIDAERIHIDDFEITDADAPVSLKYRGTWYRWTPADKTLAGISAPTTTSNATDDRDIADNLSPRMSRSPDGTIELTVRNGDLWIKTKDAEPVALTTDGRPGEEYDANVFWSPDGKKFVAIRTRQGFDRKITLTESSPKEQLQPRYQTISYRKPGDDIENPQPRLFDVASLKEIPIKNDLFDNPWELGRLHWDADSSRFLFYYNQRGHRVGRIIAIDANTGAAKALVREEPGTFIDYANKTFYRYLEQSHEIIWMSERDGWNHLYLFDARDGSLKNQVTKGHWVVRRVISLDTAARTIEFEACGFDADQDPYFFHRFRINFDGTHLVRLTEGNGTHSVTVSPSGKYLIDQWSRVDLPPITTLRDRATGEKIMDLEKGDAKALVAMGWSMPQAFHTAGRDGKTPIYGIIIRPSHFDPAKKYPVIEDIYAGPQDFFVPKMFWRFHRQMKLAELGFIVVQIDGMGTNWRNKAFLDVAWGNLGDGGFQDRKLWLKAAAKTEPAMDLSRVGIYGGSAGGQNAMRALIDHHDLYKVAVADCGCHDNRMDKIWWNELYMGWPIDQVKYDRASNTVNAGKMQGKLLLFVGELDSNVDPQSTIQLASALMKAKKDFELCLIPGAGHGCAETPYGQRKRMDFFVRNLMGVEPPASEIDHR